MPLNKNEKKDKEVRYDGPMRTTGRNKKQVNYANNGAGTTSDIDIGDAVCIRL